MLDTKGKVVLITGGASGIGFSCAKEFLRLGARGVTIADINERSGEAAFKELNDEFGLGKVIFVKTDITKQEQFEEAFKNTLATWKGIDILINNAATCNDKQWELEIDVNVTALVRGTLLGLQYMGKDNGGKGGTIVNICSVFGLEEEPSLPIYSGTKHFVIGFSRSMGTPYHYQRSGVKIVVVCPGNTVTPLCNLIKISDENFLSTEFRSLFLKYLGGTVQQLPNKVAECVIKSIKVSTGSIWVSENDEAYQILLPDRKTLRK